jgi:serine/threonine-protein kinase
MAPEQVTTKAIDRRADVFALGCVLYEACLGARPFHGADALATMYKILEEPLTPPRALDPAFPEALEAVLLKALAKDASARYATADELRAALVDYLSSTRRYFGDKHVAELLSGTLGSDLRERNRAIFATGEQLRNGETDPRRLRSPRPPEPTRTLTPEGGVERSVTQALQAQAPGRSRLLWAFAGALLVAGLLGVRSLQQETPTVTAPIAGSQPTPGSVTTPSPAPSMSPTLEPTPATASATPDASATPAQSSLNNSSSTKARPQLRPPVAEAKPAPLAKPTGKKPRPIDRDNPFAPQ